VTDQAGEIYVADGTNVIRVDDMTGTNWTSISLGTTFAPHTIAVDSSGMVVVGDGYNAQIVDSEAAVLTSSISGLVQGVYVSIYGAVPVSLPDPRPSAISLSPPTLTFSQNVGTTSAAQTITVANFGGSPLNGFGLSASGGFAATSTCPTVLAPGSTCAFSVTFSPSAAGSTAGTLTVSDDSGNLGPTQVVPLNGTGTTPAASASPATLSFSSQAVGTTSTARSITLQSTGTGPLTVTSIVTSAPFSLGLSHRPI
jgi:Abnormal spindle-like microcephaly-assoc'd, ASPM-SPD-2-Hydin